MASAERVRRLRWLCRRGMKELDVLLDRFVDRHEAGLANGAWPGFEQLLAFEDDLLWDCVQDPGRASAAAHADLLSAIRGDHA
jgi:antitoxin CptB